MVTYLYTGMGLVGLALAVGGFAVMNLLLGRSALRRRLQEIGLFTGSKMPQTTPGETADGNALMRAALAVSDRAVQRQGRSSIEQALDRAALALRPAEWMLIRGVVTIVTAAVLLLMLPWYLALPLGGLAGWLGTGKYLKRRANRRARKFADLLPEALNLVVGALRSGFSLLQSIDAVVREGPEPVAGEFGRAMAEIRLGGDLEDALERTAERNASEDLAWLVMAIRIQREVGGNLSEVLETAVETMRERGRLARHVRALSAEGRLSAYVLVGMPIALSAFLFAFRGEYLRPMYTEVLGILMLCGAGVLLAVGAFVINRMVKVEV
jgi:tight adherence protein B